MILDTNAISALADLDQALAERLDAAQNAALSFTAVAEYLYGLLGSKRPQAGQNILEGLLKILPVLLPSLETVEHYAKLAHYLKTTGNPIPTNDLLPTTPDGREERLAALKQLFPDLFHQ